MCGIYLSTDLATFEVLEQANRQRGNFATGIFYVYKTSTYDILRYENGIDWNTVKLPICTDNNIRYLGHNQAPTGIVRKWNKNTSHPFRYGDWIVAHNGIITNFKELIDELLPTHDNPVDSSIIPALLAEFEFEFGPCEEPGAEIENILYVLEKLKGTFAVWMVNIKTMNIYIARQGSTLFYKDTNISSIKGNGYISVKEGVLFSYTTEGLVEQEKFNFKSPFLTL